MQFSIFPKRYLITLLMFVLIFLPQQEVFSNFENVTNEEIKQWINQKNPDIDSFMTKSLNKDYELIYYLIKNSYYGYIIINKDNEIIEYGEGSNIPYLTNIVMNTNIRKNELQNIVYFSPIENYWEINMYKNKVYIEGYSGEWLFKLTDFQGANHVRKTINLSDKIEENYINKKLIFDPYENLLWLFKKDNQSIVTRIDLIKMLNNNEKILFNGKKYNAQADFAYSIIGYQSFDNKLFIATYDSLLNIIRYISYENLTYFGNFSLYRDLEKDKAKLSSLF